MRSPQNMQMLNVFAGNTSFVPNDTNLDEVTSSKSHASDTSVILMLLLTSSCTTHNSAACWCQNYSLTTHLLSQIMVAGMEAISSTQSVADASVILVLL